MSALTLFGQQLNSDKGENMKRIMEVDVDKG